MDLKKYRIKSNSSGNIEAEEIFMDAEAIRSMEEKGKLEKPIRQRNFMSLFLVVLLGLFLLLCRAGYLQVVKGDYYHQLAEGNRLKHFSFSAPRGVIYDKHGQALVYNVPRFDLMINLADWSDNEDSQQAEILNQVAIIIERPQKELTETIEEAYGQTAYVNIAEDVAHEQALILKTKVKEWPGLRLQKNSRRKYKEAEYFAHLIGYTGQVDKKDLEKNPDYLFNEYIGKMGLEMEYEGILRGQPGKEQVEVDSLGKIKRSLATKPAIPGQGLVLNIDGQLQKKIHDVLQGTLEEEGVQKAAAVAINPQDGGVLALVSLPSFDSNLFNQQVSKEVYNNLAEDPDEPLFNRAVSGVYPPGSTFKPLMAAAALEEDIISPNRWLSCPGVLSVVHQYNQNIVYNFLDWKAHGSVDLRKAIAESCNVFFYTIGGGYKDIDGLGIDRIKKYANLFGLGQVAGIDLPGEKAGLIPDKEWKQAVKGESWYVGDTYHAVIGQGDVLTTPLQMANTTAVLANGGTLYRPQILDKIVDSKKEEVKDLGPEIIHENFINQTNLQIVREGMRQAVLDGSARILSSLPVSSAAKTGTAQFNNNQKSHAWFTCFAPYEEPQIALAIIVEGSGEGSAVSAPVAQKVLSWYFSPKEDTN